MSYYIGLVIFTLLGASIIGILQNMPERIVPKSVNEAFLAQIVTANGQTFGEQALPLIEQGYKENNVPLLPHF